MDDSRNIVLSTAYLPPVEWFAAIGNAPLFTLEAHEHFQKGSWRNKCLIAGPNGAQRLSIPLEKGKHQQAPIREVKISYVEDWQKIHWRSIKTAYGSAPYFEHYADGLVRFYEKKEVFLFEYNLQLIQFLLKKAGWKGEIQFTDTYRGNVSLPEFVPAPYPQVFEDRHGFLPGLSMLDRLMCCGPSKNDRPV